MSSLQQIPGVGKNIEAHLRSVGIASIEDLRGRDPEELYRQVCQVEGCAVDRCLLYVFRLAVYYAEQEHREPEKLKWWYWKDKPYPLP